MVVWVKTADGRAVRLVDAWQQCFYVAGEYSDLISLAEALRLENMGFEEKFVRPSDSEPSTVLRVPAGSPREVEILAGRILLRGRYDKYQLYNVNVKPSQLYMYEKGIFPFAYVKASLTPSGVMWELHDSLDGVNYELPPLREAHLSVDVEKSGRLPSHDDPIEAITISTCGGTECFHEGGDEDKLLGLVEAIQRIDPDVIYTENGDGFLFPYLVRRATVNRVSDRLILGREGAPLRVSHEVGHSYTSYGRVEYRPTPTRLPGRLHVDRENSMLYADCGLPGIIEVARLCRIPAQRVSNTTIGTSMSSAQFYEATREGVLIPWRKTDAEELKTGRELLLADRGGFYYEPVVGLHEQVGELDFTSLYPMIMSTKNLSGETVRCKCCPDSKNRVPELGYNICEKRRGIVPRSLELLLEKRRRYKELKRTVTDPKLRSIYEMRQVALKWILVCA
jgi:DNA polymerase elongation subunit (family B)